MALYSGDTMDPRLTDSEIIERFTPEEHEYYQWLETEEFKAANRAGVHQLTVALKRRWGESMDAYFQFADMWFGRVQRRMQHPVTRDELQTLLNDTSCKNSDQLGKTLWVLDINNVPDLFIGESIFGGVLTGYVIDVGSRYLYPDLEPINRDEPYLLDRAVMAIDINVDRGPLPRRLLPPPPQPETAAQKRRRENRSSDEDSTISMRTATSEDFEDKEPFAFLQIGVLLYCTGEEWMQVRGQDVEQICEAEWDSTDYGVVVRLDRAGHPTGAVYVLYNFQKPRRVAGEGGPSWEEIEWRDPKYIELPQIRRLYPAANEKFFLAKIADKLEDLQLGVAFNFEVISHQRQMLTRAKVTEIKEMIIPSEIAAEVSEEEHKRPRAEDMEPALTWEMEIDRAYQGGTWIAGN